MRDLDELLDPTVGRQASTAARTPGFEPLVRRGRQRRRRARVTALSAAVAVIAAVSAIGTQVVQDRSDTAPAHEIEYDGPDGDLAWAIESEKVDVAGVHLGSDGSVLTVWSHWDPESPDSLARQGFTFAADGKTHWSPYRYRQLAITGLGDGHFVVRMGAATVNDVPRVVYVADADGLRKLEISSTPADLSQRYDGFAEIAVDRDAFAQVYAIDLEGPTAFPVTELGDFDVVVDLDRFAGVLGQDDGGDLWAQRDARIVRLDPAGERTEWRVPGLRDQSAIQLAADLSSGGRPIVVWSDYRPGHLNDPHQLKAATVVDGELETFAYRDAFDYDGPASTAALPDGRLLIHAGRSLLRTTDSSWRSVDDLGPVSWLPRGDDAYTLHESADRVCLAPTGLLGQRSRDMRCTVDGETWTPVDLTP